MPKVTRIDSARDGRFYEVDGVLYPSVTHILDGGYPRPALMFWAASEERKMVASAAADVYAAQWQQSCPQLPRAAYLTTLDTYLGTTKAHQKALAKGADIGTEIHQYVEWQMRRQVRAETGPEPIICEAAQWAVMAWEDFAKSVQLRPVLVERVVYSKVHGYAGTLDLLARVNGVLTVVDLKSAKSVYADNFLQVAAYEAALVEMGYLPPAGGALIVRVPKALGDPAFEVVPVPPLAELLPTFLAVKQVWAFTYAQEQARRVKRTAVA